MMGIVIQRISLWKFAYNYLQLQLAAVLFLNLSMIFERFML